jgi:hypothetical protein
MNDESNKKYSFLCHRLTGSLVQFDKYKKEGYTVIATIVLNYI